MGESGSSVFCIKIRFDVFNAFAICGGRSYMPLRFRFPYRAPRELLHGLQAATKFSNALMPCVFAGQRSISIRWSAVVASRALHQWHSGLPVRSVRRLRLNSAVERARLRCV